MLEDASRELNRFHPLLSASLLARRPIDTPPHEPLLAGWKNWVASVDTHPAPHDEVYPFVCVEEENREFHAGCAVHRVEVDGTPVHHSSHDEALHDHDQYSHRYRLADKTCLPAKLVAGIFTNDRATAAPL